MNKRWKKALLPLLLTAVILHPAVIAAQAGPNPHEMAVRHHPKRVMGGIMAGVHYEKYISLLVEKYAPETKHQWAPVLAESTRLHKELQALRKQSKGNGAHNSPQRPSSQDQLFFQQHKLVVQQFNEAVQSGDQTKIKAALSALLPVHKELNARLAGRIGNKQV
jgi:hypothetical protein